MECDEHKWVEQVSLEGISNISELFQEQTCWKSFCELGRLQKMEKPKLKYEEIKSSLTRY
jgi:hypothetical protein